MEPTPEQKQTSAEVLGRMLTCLGLNAQISDASDQREIVLSVKTGDAGRLIGRKGVYLENLELLLNRLVRHKGDPFPRITVDVDGYQRQKRGRADHFSADQERLRQQALDAAKEVKRWGEPKTLGPMSARQRRIVHLALRDDATVETESGPDEGGGMKRVVVRAAQQTRSAAQAGPED